MNKELEKRMYFFVPYNISPIQQAIQAGHAALEYARTYKDDKEFIDFADNWKTWIILNGGTTNSHFVFSEKTFSKRIFDGSLNQILENLRDKKIKCTSFNEPDLEDALTSVCFICDERVFNYEDYPDFQLFVIKEMGFEGSDYVQTKIKSIEDLEQMYPESYKKWIKSLGGEKNVFLRNLLKGKKLA